jgi:hypothetical protein
MMPQDFHQFGGIAEIVTAAIGLNINRAPKERIRKNLGSYAFFNPFASCGRFHFRSKVSVDRYPL